MKTTSFRPSALATLFIASVISTMPGHPMLAASDGAVSGDGSAPGSIVCETSDDCPIPYEYLANQETDPFLFAGKLMNEEHPRWRQYRRVLRKYPDVRDCLVEEEREKEGPNLLLMDWQQTGTGNGAEVCIFLIARSLGSIDRHQQWLAFHKFRLEGPKQLFSQDFTPRISTQVVSIVAGFWTTEQYRALNPSWFARVTGLETVQGYQILLQYSERQRVVGAAISSRSK